MLSQSILWCGGLLGLGIVYRAVRARLLDKYPFFYAYLLSTLGFTFTAIVFVLRNRDYAAVYWPLQFLTLVFGCGVVLEILRHDLTPYPGPKRLAVAVAVLAFCIAVLIGILSLVFVRDWLPAAGMFELERNVRAVQAALLFGIMGLTSYYRIPTGRNMRGLTVGYGSYISVSLVIRALQAFTSHWLASILGFGEAFAFVFASIIWLISLWSYQPNPVPVSSTQIENDYRILASRTRRALRGTRSYIGRATRL